MTPECLRAIEQLHEFGDFLRSHELGVSLGLTFAQCGLKGGPVSIRGVQVSHKPKQEAMTPGVQLRCQSQ